MIIIDVVEGTAMEALPFMENIIKSMPKSFNSLEEAIQYRYIFNISVMLIKLSEIYNLQEFLFLLN